MVIERKYMKKQKKLKVGDYLFRFIGDASPSRNKSNDRYFIAKYIIVDIVYNPPTRTLIIRRILDDEIDKSVTRWWYSELAKDYEIQEVS